MTERAFDAAINHFYKFDAPASLREMIENRSKGEIMDPTYPYREKMHRKEYERRILKLHIELVKLQAWATQTGKRIVILLEGRDAAGKGGTIKRFREHLNPRYAKVIALSKPSKKESSEWYFQRYIQYLPSAGEIAFFDRSWYNRAVVEHVFGFCTDSEREQFFEQVTQFEKMIKDDGTTFIKIWLNVSRAEQLRRILDRKIGSLKYWKLSPIDVEGLNKWDEYSDAIRETFERTNTKDAPWLVIRAEDKRRARIAAIKSLLSQIDYDEKDETVAGAPDSSISGNPETILAANPSLHM